MDQIKIGKFIAARRKAASLTQMQLAEKLGITDRAISKWENGKTMPDSSIMLDLCEILEITVNDLLHGEVVTVDNYNKELENTLLKLVKEKEASDKQLLNMEIVLGVLSTIILLGCCIIAAYANMSNLNRAILIIVGFVLGLIGFFYCLRIEQTAGYYDCKNCGHTYIPTFMNVTKAPHMGRTRYMKCPNCGQKSWQK